MKQNYDKIFERLSTIMYRLSSGEELSVATLASETSVHTRTVARDLNDILKNHFPLKKNKKNWKMDDNYHLSNAEIDRIIQYHMIEKLVKDSGEEFYNRSKEILIQIKNKIDISDFKKPLITGS
jgi:DNA-binding transcriptional regulator YhcF (GntR family)